MTQSELVEALKKHLMIGDDGSMKVKEVKDVGKVSDYEKKVKEKKVKEVKPKPSVKEVKPEPSVKDDKSKGLKKEVKPEPKNENIEKKKEPELKTPPPSTPAKEKTLHDRLIKLKELGHEKVVDYDGGLFSSYLFHLNFLHKHKYDCIIRPEDYDELDERDQEYFIYNFLTKIIKCIKDGSKIIAIPFGFSNHFNMIIYNVKLNELYRYEPHGQEYADEKSDKNLNNMLFTFVKDERIIKEFGKIKYISPVESCPKIKHSVSVGFQSMENYYLQILLTNKQMKEVLKKEGGGFCQAWSWFMLDLIMLNPDKSINEIYKEAHTTLQHNPYKFRAVIRGFILEVESELLNINKDLSIQKLAVDVKNKDYKYKNNLYKFYEDEIKRLSKQ